MTVQYNLLGSISHAEGENTVYDASERRITFRLNKSHNYVVNAIRRVLISDVIGSGLRDRHANPSPVEGKFSQQSSESPIGMKVHCNTGRLHNEFLMHRLAMLPLALAREALQTNQLVLRLRVKCPDTGSDPIHVTSEDIQLHKQTIDQTAEVAEEDIVPLLSFGTQLIPTDPKVDEALGDDNTVKRGVLITRLLSRRGD